MQTQCNTAIATTPPGHGQCHHGPGCCGLTRRNNQRAAGNHKNQAHRGIKIKISTANDPGFWCECQTVRAGTQYETHDSGLDQNHAVGLRCCHCGQHGNTNYQQTLNNLENSDVASAYVRTQRKAAEIYNEQYSRHDERRQRLHRPAVTDAKHGEDDHPSISAQSTQPLHPHPITPIDRPQCCQTQKLQE